MEELRSFSDSCESNAYSCCSTQKKQLISHGLEHFFALPGSELPNKRGENRVSLDKLALSETSPPENANCPAGKQPEYDVHERLKKRNRAKWIGQHIIDALASIDDSPLHKSYVNSKYCSSVVMVEDGRTRSTYCKNRWCLVCSRNKTGVMINRYEDAIRREIKEPYFVTLTNLNVCEADLSEEVSRFIKFRTSTNKRFYKRFQRAKSKGKSNPENYKMRAVWGLEGTYNHIHNDYNPHFHILIDGEEAANELVDCWLKTFPEADMQAQKVKPADEGSLLEVFKYSVKMLSEDILESKKKGKIYVRALDKLYQAFRGRMLIRSYNLSVEVNDEISEEEMEAYQFAENEDMDGVYSWVGDNWYNMETGESLTTFVLGPKELALPDIIVTDFLPTWSRARRKYGGKSPPT